MVTNLSQGTVQIYDLSIVEVNQALRELAERVDALSGLRGRVEIQDRIRADDPTEQSDVLTRQLTGEITDFNPTSLTTLTGASTALTVTGAQFGDFVHVSFSIAHNFIFWQGHVEAADTVRVQYFNRSAGTVNLGVGTLRVHVWNYE